MSRGGLGAEGRTFQQFPIPRGDKVEREEKRIIGRATGNGLDIRPSAPIHPSPRSKVPAPPPSLRRRAKKRMSAMFPFANRMTR